LKNWKIFFLFWFFSDEQIERMAIEKTKRLAKRLLNETEATTTIIIQDDEKDDEKWDCETVLTTYSNAYNHPKLITQIPTNKIRLSRKTGLPLADKNKITTKQTSIEEQDDDDDDDNQQSSIIFQRKKGETTEERRARKQAVKEIRRVNFNSFFLSFY
jgi:protein LTV1